MLRIVVISLFVANLLLLGFQASKPAAEPEMPASNTVSEDTSIPTLYLFSELAQDEGLMIGNRQCFSLGPFHSSGDRDEALSQLRGVSVSTSERQTQAMVEKGYWVFMPPYLSLLEANQVLFSLQALGLEDVSVMYDGEWKNAISLGYFLRQKNAVSRKNALEDRGYEPQMRVRRKVEPRYWLEYEKDPESGSLALDSQNYPDDFMRRSLPCPGQTEMDEG